jgi:predicted XRE-type DNA-binding protein
MIWDCKSTGTLSNVIHLLKEKKKSVVFVDKKEDFVTITDRADLDYLLNFMSEHARAKAEEKIGLSRKVAELGREQFSLSILGSEQTSSPQEDHPGTAAEEVADIAVQSESIRLRSELMSALKEYIYRAHLNQSQAAEVLGVTPPRISDLTRDKVDLFGLDALVDMATMAGLRVEMRVCDTA